jgi:hypothetical protein
MRPEQTSCLLHSAHSSCGCIFRRKLFPQSWRDRCCAAVSWRLSSCCGLRASLTRKHRTQLLLRRLPNPPRRRRWKTRKSAITYELYDDISGNLKSTFTATITDVSGSDISVRTSVIGNSNVGFVNYDRSWNRTSNDPWRFTPNDGSGIRPPLAVGKTWSVKANDFNGSAGVGQRRSVTSKVVAQESVTTKAGTFETFKIETSFELQSSKDPTRKAQDLWQTWYAPSIDHWVKQTSVFRSDGRVRSKTSTELVEYGRR